MNNENLPTLDELFTETCRLIGMGGPTVALIGMQFPADTVRGAVEFVVRSHSRLPGFSRVQPSWNDVSSQLAPWKKQLIEEAGDVTRLGFPGGWIYAFAAPESRHAVIEATRRIIRACVAHYLMSRIAHERPDLMDEDWDNLHLVGVIL